MPKVTHLGSGEAETQTQDCWRCTKPLLCHSATQPLLSTSPRNCCALTMCQSLGWVLQETAQVTLPWPGARQARREGSRMAPSQMETGERSQGGLRENLSASPLPKNREGSQRWIRLKAGPGGWVRSQPAETSGEMRLIRANRHLLNPQELAGARPTTLSSKGTKRPWDESLTRFPGWCGSGLPVLRFSPSPTFPPLTAVDRLSVADSLTHP